MNPFFTADGLTCCDWSSQVTVYLGKRDFVDHLDHVDPVGELKCLGPAGQQDAS